MCEALLTPSPGLPSPQLPLYCSHQQTLLGTTSILPTEAVASLARKRSGPQGWRICVVLSQEFLGQEEPSHSPSNQTELHYLSCHTVPLSLHPLSMCLYIQTSAVV